MIELHAGTADAGWNARESIQPNNGPQLYSNPVYARLVRKFGTDSVFILSAGWGLISASFLTPLYDITFSMSAEGFKRRKKRDPYLDFSQLGTIDSKPVLFFGGKDYLPLFCALTEAAGNQRVVFYNSRTTPQLPNCTFARYHTTMRTNWHMRGGFPVKEDHGVATATIVSHAPRIARCTCAQRGNRRICEQRKSATIALTDAL